MDRKTIFVTLVDGREDELHQLREVLRKTGIDKQYLPVVTYKPVHVMDPLDLISGMQAIYNIGDDQFNDQLRIQRFVQAIRGLSLAVEGLLQEAKVQRQNMNMLQMGQDLTSFMPLQSVGLEDATRYSRYVKNQLPQEGEKF